MTDERTTDEPTGDPIDDAPAPSRAAPPVQHAGSASLDAPAPRCPRCRYRLDETPLEAPCPECGTISTAAGRIAYARRQSTIRTLLIHFSPMLVTAVLILLVLFTGAEALFAPMIIALYAFIPWTLIQSTLLHSRWMRRRALIANRETQGGAMVTMLIVSIVTAAGVAAASVALLFSSCLVLARFVNF